jgi:hypothetical protein
MPEKAKFRIFTFRWRMQSFLLLFLLVTVFCSSCYLTRGKDQWSYTKKDLERQILKNPNDYGAYYELGIAYAIREGEVSIPYNWKKFFFTKAILYLSEAVRINPESAEAHLALAKVLGNKRIKNGIGAIRHTVISKKLFESQNNTDGVALAEANIQVLSKNFFSFYLLGFSDMQIPEPLQQSPPAFPTIANPSRSYESKNSNNFD